MNSLKIYNIFFWSMNMYIGYMFGWRSHLHKTKYKIHHSNLNINGIIGFLLSFQACCSSSLCCNKSSIQYGAFEVSLQQVRFCGSLCTECLQPWQADFRSVDEPRKVYWSSNCVLKLPRPVGVHRRSNCRCGRRRGRLPSHSPPSEGHGL